VNVFLWHVHGSYTTALVQGAHDYFLPVEPGRGPDGRGRARTWEWPANAKEVDAGNAADAPVDVVVLQRPHELESLAAEWLGGRRPGVDVPAVYLEHNTPPGPAAATVHPVADHPGIPLVHVTHCNALFWDVGAVPVQVIEHGIIDPGHRYSGDLARSAVVINDPCRRGRVTGTDLLDRFRDAGPLDLFGMQTAPLGGADLPQDELHDALARRRVYLHTTRWTSLGLSLIEAMHLGMPVVALATSEVPLAVPAGCGVVSTDVDELVRATRELLADRDVAAELGRRGRAHARRRYGLERFLDDWDQLFKEVTR
jgi:hypothetical protein